MTAVYGPGMHQFVLDELEFGFRVACAFDHAQAWGPELDFFWAFDPGPIE